MLRFDVITIFPEIFAGPLDASLMGKARERGLVTCAVHDLRPFGDGRHQTTDDYPYGGGAGMVMKVAPVVRCIESLPSVEAPERTLLMSPGGRPLTGALARELAQLGRITLICGRYEGVDERLRSYIDGEISIGDYILSGGELAALVVIDAVARFVPGVLGNAESLCTESFEDGVLEHPQYTRPPSFRGAEVPAVLRSGDHGQIGRWRRRQSLLRTKMKRPDLFARLTLSAEDRELLDSSE